MREFIVENLTNTEALSVTVILMNNVIALIVAFFIMFTYKISYAGPAYSRKFNISIGSITIITAMIMSIISNNIALSLGMVGALSIIRFRTAVQDVRDKHLNKNGQGLRPKPKRLDAINLRRCRPRTGSAPNRTLSKSRPNQLHAKAPPTQSR